MGDLGECGGDMPGVIGFVNGWGVIRTPGADAGASGGNTGGSTRGSGAGAGPFEASSGAASGAAATRGLYRARESEPASGAALGGLGAELGLSAVLPERSSASSALSRSASSFI